MDNSQNDHLKAYGFAFWILKKNDNVDWLLNYKGGAFLINNKAIIVKYQNEYYFPVLSGYIPGSFFGQDVPGETMYRNLKRQFNSDENN